MAPHLPAVAFGACPAPASSQSVTRANQAPLSFCSAGEAGMSGHGQEAGDSHAGYPGVDRLIGHGLTAERRARPGDREPAADLMRAVAGQLELLVGQIKHGLDVAPLKHVEEPPVELLVDVSHPRYADEVRQATRPDQRDPVQTDVGTDG